MHAGLQRIAVKLASPASDMAQEEIRKQVAFLRKDVSNVSFSPDGTEISLDAGTDGAQELQARVSALAERIQKGLRNLQRKLVFRSATAENPTFAENADVSGIHFLGTGQVALEGIPLKLFRYFDRVFEAFRLPWHAVPLSTPTLIPAPVLARCDYFRSFPHNVTFAAHLREEAPVIEGFRARHQNLDDVDDAALGDMSRPEACLSPAVCYHVYHLNQNRVIPAEGLFYSICGKCFRYESSNISDLRRLWDFTMREVVFLGSRQEVLRHRDKSISMMSDFLDRHRLAGEIRTASDPFFIAPDAVAKTYFQLSAESKFEVSLMLPGGERVAVGSHNYHSDFFGKVFNTQVEGAGPMHSVCVAFGLERWVHAFLAQHGSDVASWPETVRQAPEFVQPMAARM